MSNRLEFHILRIVCPLVTAAVMLCAAALASASEANGQLRRSTVNYWTGTVVDYANGRLTVLTEAGEVLRVMIGPRTRIALLRPADFSEIGEGSYIASAGRAIEDESVEAYELRIVEEKLRGVGEGHRPFHVSEDSTMTNAKVVGVVDPISQSILVRYRGKDLTIVVPDSAPVMHQLVGDSSDLLPGAPVSLLTVRSRRGKTDVVRVNIGLDGVIPLY